MRAADRRRPDDQERRAAADGADAVCDRERADGARRSAARRLSGFRGQHPLLRAAAAAAPGGAGRRGGHAVGRTACGRKRQHSGADRRARPTRSESDYPLAREGIVTPGYFETFQTHGHRRPRVHHQRHRGRPAGRDRQRVVRAGCTSPAWIRVGRQFKRIRPGQQGAVADGRRPGAGSADGGHRQQRREPGRLLHPDRAERRRQRRPHRGPHARRRRRR